MRWMAEPGATEGPGTCAGVNRLPDGPEQQGVWHRLAQCGIVATLKPQQGEGVCSGQRLERPPDRRVVVICSCPTSNWEALQPAFTKLIESLQYGQAKT